MEEVPNLIAFSIKWFHQVHLFSILDKPKLSWRWKRNDPNSRFKKHINQTSTGLCHLNNHSLCMAFAREGIFTPERISHQMTIIKKKQLIFIDPLFPILFFPSLLNQTEERKLPQARFTIRKETERGPPPHGPTEGKCDSHYRIILQYRNWVIKKCSTAALSSAGMAFLVWL